jgi:hypothetical protein
LIGGFNTMNLINSMYYDTDENYVDYYGGTYNVNTSIIRNTFVNSYSGTNMIQGTPQIPSMTSDYYTNE